MKRQTLLIGAIGLYLLYQVISTWLLIDNKVQTVKYREKHFKVEDLEHYMHNDTNLSALKIHKIWGIPEYEKPKPKTQENNTTVEKKSFELRESGGFYTIIIGKKELDFLGVAKSAKKYFMVLFDAKGKKGKKIIHYYEGDNLAKGIKLHKIDENFVLLIDTLSHEKSKIPYFFVNEDKFKPKDNNES
jgi:hypothetical protein